MIGRGRALLVYSAQGEQGLAFRTYGHDWKPVDFDGIQLIMRRATGDGPSAIPDAPMTPEVGGKSNVAAGWSSTARRRKFARSRSRPG